jgi:alpha-L-rhamnosidase
MPDAVALDHALWIGPYEATVAAPGERPAYWLRREFGLAAVGRAQVQIAVRGLVEVFVNGTRVGDELLPGYTQYDLRLPVRTIDFSDYLRNGANSIVLLLADGWFRGQTGAVRAADQFGTSTSVAAVLVVAGDVALASDGSWRSAPSHVLTADLIAGQSEDRRRFDASVLLPGHDDSDWQHVVVHDPPTAALVEYDTPPVRRVEELVPVSVTELRPRVHIVDLGQNINGWTRLSDLGPAATAITLTHGEWLDRDGDVSTDHLRVDFPFLADPLPAGQVDHIVSAGRDDDLFEPRLTTHGFRYVRIEGHPGPLGPDAVRGVVVHSDLPRTGWFECDDERINRLHEAAVWSLRGNMCEIPTDCPHRERSGWTGDWQIFAPAAAFLYDVDAFTRKWLADVRLAQGADGMVKNHAPSTPAEGTHGPAAALQGSAGWGDVIVAAPWALYEAYGDPAPLAENWGAMEAWVTFAERSARNGRSPARTADRPHPAPHDRFLWDTGFHWGEWLEPGFEINDFGAFVAADKSDVATAYLYRSAATMVEIAELLDRPSAIERYRELADGSLDAWRREFITESGELAIQTQASHVRALAFDLVPDELRGATADRLAELVRAAGTTVGTGFLSTGMLLSTLADHGHLDLAYELLLQPKAPGWMYMIDHGATTVWERWEGVDADGVPHESLNHYSKGAVVSFLHRYVAGLRPTSPGYRTFEVRPRPGGGITHTSERLDTRYGRIDIDWHDRRGGFELQLVVPAGTEAAVVMPNGDTDVAGPGRHAFAIQRTSSTETA